jgi:hypothetical protein
MAKPESVTKTVLRVVAIMLVFVCIIAIIIPGQRDPEWRVSKLQACSIADTPVFDRRFKHKPSAG